MKPKYFLMSLLILELFAKTANVNAQSIIPNNSTSQPSKETSSNSFSIGQRNSITVPTGEGQTIQDIEIRFIDKEGNPKEGKTKPHIIRQEFKLQPGDIYNAELAQSGLAGVNELVIVKQATLTLEPTASADEVVMVVTVQERKSFFFSFGSTLQPPTALQGSARPVTVNAMSNASRGIGSGIRLGATNLGRNNQAITLGIEGGEKRLGFDFDYRKFIRNDRGYAANFFNRRSVEPEFDGGEREVDLITSDDIWINRIGGGVEYFLPIAKEFKSSIGVTYQLVSVRDALFSDQLVNVDELGNTLTFGDDGQDGLLTVTFVTAWDRRNENLNPTKGYRLSLQTDQSIPVGDASIAYNRLSGNYTHFFPVNLFKFSKGQPTFLINFQGGTIIGDLPGYEAFSLGGSSSVRGYGKGELGTARSFIQATAEYRFPMFSFNAFKRDVDIRGAIFFDYGTDLGSGDTVTGEPAIVRNKPGDGFGYGIGLHGTSPVGLIKLEFALNDQGDGRVIFRFGDRF